jgi:hypothetical protein
MDVGVVRRLPDRETLLKLAGASGLDPRTVKRALERGVDSLRAEVDRERLRNAAAKIGIQIA